MAAHRAFGSVAQAKEFKRDTRALAWVEHLRRDVRLACRSLARTWLHARGHREGIARASGFVESMTSAHVRHLSGA